MWAGVCVVVVVAAARAAYMPCLSSILSGCEKIRLFFSRQDFIHDIKILFLKTAVSRVFVPTLFGKTVNSVNYHLPNT